MAKSKDNNKPFNMIDTDTGEIILFPEKRIREKAKDGSMRGAPFVYVTPEQWNTIKVMAGLMATDEEISDAIQISTRTLNDDYHGKFFQAIKKAGQGNAKISLRRAQFESAIKKGNTSMQIFLGKQYLGQKDVVENASNDMAINISVVPASGDDVDIDN